MTYQEITSPNLGTSIDPILDPTPNQISQPLNITFNTDYLIVDDSGSMYGSKIGGFKKGVNGWV